MAILNKTIMRLFQILLEFPFATSETELDYHHQKLYVKVIERLRNLSFKEIAEKLLITSKYWTGHPIWKTQMLL